LSLQFATLHAVCPRSKAPSWFLTKLTNNADNAYIEAQKQGNNSALCAVNSTFAIDYQNCTACVVDNGDTSKVSLQSYVEPEFQPFLEYCESLVNSTNSTTSTVNAAQASQISSQLSQASLVSSILAEASSLGLNVGSTAEITSTVLYTQTAVSSQPFSGNATSLCEIS
jgi:hypothetical protein